mgnify:CR=1 FL=1
MNVIQTHDEVAREVGLDAFTTKRFVAYMRARWPKEELLHCQTGYAHEWAHRFKNGIEFAASDSDGQAVLSKLT